MRGILIPLLFFTFPICGQEYQVHRHLDTLCGSYMAGRGYVEDGHLKAAHYIAAEFESYGLQKAGDSWLQEFELDVNTFPGKLELKIGKNKLRPGYDFIPKSFCGRGKGRKKIHLLDTLIFSDQERAKAFLAEKTDRRVLVYRSEDLERINALPSEYIDKIYSSAATIELKKKLTLGYSSRQYNDVVFDVLDSLFDDKSRRIKFRAEPVFKEGLKTNNVIAILPAKIKTDSSVLITAHYDHIGKIYKAWIPGANDNASGVAMMLDLAKNFAERGNPYPYNLVFIAFGGEESGLLGSHFFTRHPLVNLRQIRFVLNLDLMGNGEEGITVVNGSVFENEMQILDSLNNENPNQINIKKRGPAANSDHYHFSQKGIPAFFIYTMGGEPWYHDVYDTPDSLTLDAYQEIIELIEAFISSI